MRAKYVNNEVLTVDFANDIFTYITSSRVMLTSKGLHKLVWGVDQADHMIKSSEPEVNYADHISDTPRFVGLRESIITPSDIDIKVSKDDIDNLIFGESPPIERSEVLKEQIFGRQERWT